MAKTREERVKEKLARERAKLHARRKEREAPKKAKKRPYVKNHNTALRINNEKLRKMAEDRIAEIEEKMKNRVNNDEHFQALKEEQGEIAKEWDASNE